MWLKIYIMASQYKYSGTYPFQSTLHLQVLSMLIHTALIHSDFCIVSLSTHDTIYLSNILYLSCFYISIITNNAGMNTLNQSTHLETSQGGMTGWIHLQHFQMLARPCAQDL